jgi:hypothetical protein
MFDVCLKIHIDTGYQGRDTMIFILGQIVFNPVKLFGSTLHWLWGLLDVQNIKNNKYHSGKFFLRFA